MAKINQVEMDKLNQEQEELGMRIEYLEKLTTKDGGSLDEELRAELEEELEQLNEKLTVNTQKRMETLK